MACLPGCHGPFMAVWLQRDAALMLSGTCNPTHIFCIVRPDPWLVGVDCDVSIGSSNAIFKAKAFKALAARERRFGDMLRLVKAWARAHGLNDAADGTFNSFALGLMVGPPYGFGSGWAPLSCWSGLNSLL